MKTKLSLLALALC
ncbi:hypothetical protein D043_0572A, partial [Vibrio parahaemolyticus EKP-021]